MPEGNVTGTLVEWYKNHPVTFEKLPKGRWIVSLKNSTKSVLVEEKNIKLKHRQAKLSVQPILPALTAEKEEIRFFAGLKRFYKAGEHVWNLKKYSTKRWLKRLCVLREDGNGKVTLSVYKSRNSWWKLWQLRRKKRPSSKSRSKKYNATALTKDDLKNIDLKGETPCRELTLEYIQQTEIDSLKNDERTYTHYKSTWKHNNICVKGIDANKYNIFSRYTPFQKWVLSVYDMENNEQVVADVNTLLRHNRKKGPIPVLKQNDDAFIIRRRLSPGEELLHDRRLASPCDPLVLARLLEEIQEADQ